MCRQATVKMLLACGLVLTVIPLGHAGIIVPSDGTTVQSQPLASGVEYTVQASGTFYFWSPNTNMSDAAWDQDPFRANSTSWNYEGDSLFINNQSLFWLGTTDGITFSPHTFSPTHVYQDYVLGTGQPLDFKINDSYYPDNSGNLEVTITASAAPEPASLTLLGVGTVTLIGYGWRRRKKAATAAS